MLRCSKMNTALATGRLTFSCGRQIIFLKTTFNLRKSEKLLITYSKPQPPIMVVAVGQDLLQALK